MGPGIGQQAVQVRFVHKDIDTVQVEFKIEEAS